jgi:hypothetical protein
MKWVNTLPVDKHLPDRCWQWQWQMNHNYLAYSHKLELPAGVHLRAVVGYYKHGGTLN